MSNIKQASIPNIDLEIQPYQSYLPTAFDNSLTIAEKINKLIYIIAELDERIKVLEEGASSNE